MKLEKKHWIIIGIVVAIILVWYFFMRKKPIESNYSKGGRKVIPGTNIKYDYTLPKGTPLSPEQRKFCIDRWGINWCIQIGGAGVSCKTGWSCCTYADGSDPLTTAGACIRCCPNVI